jgi:hypothetical protein
LQACVDGIPLPTAARRLFFSFGQHPLTAETDEASSIGAHPDVSHVALQILARVDNMDVVTDLKLKLGVHHKPQSSQRLVVNLGQKLFTGFPPNGSEIRARIPLKAR